MKSNTQESKPLKKTKMAEIQALPAPPLDTPQSNNTCDLWAIDAICELVRDAKHLLQPEIKGHEKINLPTYAFYIYNPRLDKRVLFDAGIRKYWWNLPPKVVSGITSGCVTGLLVKDEVYDTLAAHHKSAAEKKEESIVDPDTIDAVIWSHFHNDHVGNIQRYPKSTSIVVGAGFKETILPGYPVRKDAPLYQADYEDRELIEISFDLELKIGKYDAHDFSGDGSFYLVRTPGHTVEHISGFVRTTADTFVFLGGDNSHFPGMYRPTAYKPLSATLPVEIYLDSQLPVPCPCLLFTACHPNHSTEDVDDHAARTRPFYQPNEKSSWYHSTVMALSTFESLQEFAADENVFVA